MNSRYLNLVDDKVFIYYIDIFKNKIFKILKFETLENVLMIEYKSSVNNLLRIRIHLYRYLRVFFPIIVEYRCFIFL